MEIKAIPRNYCQTIAFLIGGISCFVGNVKEKAIFHLNRDLQLHFFCAIIYLLYNRGSGHTISAALSLLETDKQRNILSEFYKENKNRFYAIAFSKLHNREAAVRRRISDAYGRIRGYIKEGE